jgi:anti-sigma28 factor (negative regulator of flagellin synthesis)
MERPEKPSSDDRPKADPLNALDLNRIDEARLKKIAKLKTAVADGTYHVSAEKLADKLIEHMLEPKS